MTDDVTFKTPGLREGIPKDLARLLPGDKLREVQATLTPGQTVDEVEAELKAAGDKDLPAHVFASRRLTVYMAILEKMHDRAALSARLGEEIFLMKMLVDTAIALIKRGPGKTPTAAADDEFPTGDDPDINAATDDETLRRVAKGAV